MSKSSLRGSDPSAVAAAAASAHPESPHSPLRFHSPLRSELGDPADTPPYSSPAASPEKPPPAAPKPAATADRFTQCSLIPSPSPSPDVWRTRGAANFSAKEPPPATTVVSRAVRQEGFPSLTKSQDRRPAAAPGMPALRSSATREMLQRVALGVRVCELVLCLIAFSVMAADRTKGWSGDSFDRYKEYSYFDFLMDQVLAYLLISASSSAATRVDDWQSNWGKDQFTRMASASVSMSFLAFVAFAVSSIISGYFLFTPDIA